MAQQTHEQLQLFAKKLSAPKLRTVLIIGGLPVKEQMDELEDGVDIITCTPGRAFDFISQGKIKLGYVRFFVLDEAVSF